MSSRSVGVVSRGIRCPIFKDGDNLVKLIPEILLEAKENEGFEFKDRDVIAITESVVARTQGNYATIDDIAIDIKNKFKDGDVGVVFPILSRNRFSIILKGIARGAKRITLMLSYPSDEVGNALLTYDELDEKNINPYSDVLTYEKYLKLFGHKLHEFTGVDYPEFYKEIITNEGCECNIIFANRPQAILSYTKNILCCDIHTRNRTKRLCLENGANIVFTLSDILSSSINGSGYNKTYGLLGSNKSTEEKLKLFPRDADNLVLEIQQKMKEITGKNIEVMVYGDGAFKDPQGKIWELADPVVSPFYTNGLKGTPNELKLKYLADDKFKDLKGDELKEAINKEIINKNNNLKGNMASQGTTPRQITDLLGSLCDLTSGSGDKGTPVVYIQGYFDNYTTD